MRLLELENLTVTFQKRVVDGISFCINSGEIVGIVGESGSGKSMTALSLMGLTPEDAKVSWDKFSFGTAEGKPISGKDIAMIFQEPMTSLNPVLTIGKQVAEMLQIHEHITRREAKEQTLRMLERVGLEGNEEFFYKYPHELSGGMRQRVMIAMAMICKPRLLIADEPTTALDIEVQEQILELILNLNQEMETAVLFISHDIKLVHRFCRKVIVMNKGKIEETGFAEQIFYEPQAEYTKALLDALPSKEKKGRSTSECSDVLKVERLFASYGKKKVLKNITFSLKKGEVLGIVGSSGCGKSTLAQVLTGLKVPDSGKIETLGSRVGMVFQDPYSSLNPCKTVGFLLEEPLRIRKVPKVERKQRVWEMVVWIGLSANYLKRKVDELSGGQRQRVAIGCALMNYPEILILDEPVSALDVTIQDKICKLLNKCKEKYKLSYIFISHDPEIMEMMCDRILRLKEGAFHNDY